MEDVVRTHALAAVLVEDYAAQLVPERFFPVKIPAFHHAFVQEHVVEDYLAPGARHLVLSLEGLGQVIGLGAYAGGLLPEVLHCVVHHFLDGGGAFVLGLFLRLEGLLHGFEVLAQGAGEVLEGFLGLLLQGLFPLFEELFRLGR